MRDGEPEIIIGLVGALGTDLETVSLLLEQSLARASYRCSHVRVSGLLDALPKFAEGVERTSEERRLSTTMAQCTAFRNAVERGDAMAGLAVSEIRRLRESLGGKFEPRVYLVRQLKRSDEVEALREVYRDQFLLLGIYMPRRLRVDSLATRLARDSGTTAEAMRGVAEALIIVDEKEPKALGQDVRGTFHLSDIFLAGADRARLAREVDRFVDILFGKPCMTPTRDEYGMFHAQAAALRSAALARQVGAAIVSEEGDVIAVGMNDVPRGGGGHYWHGDEPDGRDFVRGFDQNDELKGVVLAEVISRLKSNHLLNSTLDTLDSDAVLRTVRKALDGTRILSLTEFGREVHAEMSALITAARRGTAVAGAVLYTTTFPCHNCAKHIVAAGISKVVYVEPYPKSFASEFHPDSIAVESDQDCNTRVRFEPFVGVAPHKYLDWFKMSSDRKGADGKLTRWSPSEQLPAFARSGVDIGYGDREAAYVESIKASLTEKALLANDDAEEVLDTKLGAGNETG